MKREKMFPRPNVFLMDASLSRFSRTNSFVYQSTSGTIKWQVESGQYFIEVTRVEKFQQDVNENSSLQFYQ